MKTLISILVVVVTVFAVGTICPQAAEQRDQPSVTETTDGAAAGQPKMVGNKICPVSGESVDGMNSPFQYEYKGEIYNLCCRMCMTDLKKDPEKYSKIAEEEASHH